MAGCLTAKVGPTQEDAALMIVQENSQPKVSSYNSAIQTRIIRQEKAGDTLFITYRKGALLSRAGAWAHNTVQLNEQTKYVRCANRLFSVVKTNPGFALEQLKNPVKAAEK
ncbi:hypothetical protein LGH70_14010 [Hymenobacter sp. BT635]|uniref:Lipoprotein n=1 Tax=Hymenobacter nitidus TaxID=2880929 RepID=A0ABS8AFH7_9BACT|nr:hypothetical protein [Hymenobacter nitidus]MCB2378712.1 hypothetical protein [Hymenobacter nitidus]